MYFFARFLAAVINDMINPKSIDNATTWSYNAAVT